MIELTYLNLLHPDFYLAWHQPPKSAGVFLFVSVYYKKVTKIQKKKQWSNAKEREKIFLDQSLYPSRHPNKNGVYSGQRVIPHPSFGEIFLQTNQWTNGYGRKHNLCSGGDNRLIGIKVIVSWLGMKWGESHQSEKRDYRKDIFTWAKGHFRKVSLANSLFAVSSILIFLTS